MQCHLSVQIWLHCELFFSLSFPAQLEMNLSQSFLGWVEECREREIKKNLARKMLVLDKVKEFEVKQGSVTSSRKS